MSIPVFVISPKEIEGRRKETEAHLRKAGVSPVFFSGLYGPDLQLASGYNCDRPYSAYKNQRSGSICLSLNHWFLWQHIVLSGIESAIVFEDDVVVPDNFWDYFGKMIRKTPSDWEMVYMSLLYPERIGIGKILCKEVGDGVWQHIRASTWDGACDGLHAYLISQGGAKKFVGLRLTLDEPMDRWISFHGLPSVRTYIWKDSEIHQRVMVGETDDKWKRTY